MINRIKIFPTIPEEHLSFFNERIQENKLVGCMDINYNGIYLLNKVTHKIDAIISHNDDMWALVEFLDTKEGNYAYSIYNSESNIFQLKEVFINENNIGLNIIYTKN